MLLPWGAWRVMKARRNDPAAGSLFGLSPLPLRITALAGTFGGLAYAMLAYAGFFYAPAAHASPTRAAISVRASSVPRTRCR